MTKQEISEYVRIQYPRENEGCDWKEYKNLRNSLCGHEGDDVVSYVSAISNMNGGAIVIGIQDKTFDVVGIQDFGNYTIESAKAKIVEKCRNISSEELNIDELTAEDTGEKVWIITIPKHKPRLPVYAHNKAWQRIGDSLVGMTDDRLRSILTELVITDDWSVLRTPRLQTLIRRQLRRRVRSTQKGIRFARRKYQHGTIRSFLIKQKLQLTVR